MSTSYIYGTGRRKTSVARVRLLPGDGQIVVNGKDVAEYFGGTGGAGALRLPFRDRDRGSVLGLGAGCRWRILRPGRRHSPRHRPRVAQRPSGRPGRAARGGAADADPRAKERKKYGLKRARKAPQYTKR